MRKTLKQIFEDKYIKLDNGCWQWTANISTNGYGQISRNKTTCRAHRIAYNLYIGEIPEGMVVCHKCDNKLCVNPDHLFIGTQEDNIRDCLNKDRNAYGSRNAKAKLKEDDIFSIKVRYKNGVTMQEIGNIFGVSKNTISQVINNKTWAKIKKEKI